MALISDMSQITIIYAVSTKFKQDTPYNLRRITEHKVGDKEMCLISTVKTITCGFIVAFPVAHLATLSADCPAKLHSDNTTS